MRDIQCPEAKAIKVDGTPIWPKSRKKEEAGEAMDEMEEVEYSAPAKLSREEQVREGGRGREGGRAGGREGGWVGWRWREGGSFRPARPAYC